MTSNTQPLRVAAAILLVVALEYGWTLHHPFHFDDSHTIVGNPSIQSAANLLKLWTSASYYSVTPDNFGYRPLTTTLNALCWLAGHGASWPFQLVKKLLHAGTCFLLYLAWAWLLARPGFFPEKPPRLRLGRREWVIGPELAAAGIALVFALHPANTQVLDYIAAVSTGMAGFWYLAGYVLYLRFRDAGYRGVGTALAACVCYALSIMSKEEGITLPAIVLLTEWLAPTSRRIGPETEAEQAFAAGRARRGLAALAGLALTGAGCALLLKLMFAESSNWARGSMPRWHYFMTQWRAYLRYMRLLFIPSGMNADNLAFGFSGALTDPGVLSALAVNLLLLGSAWIRRHRAPLLLFALLWFYIAISPASSVVPLAEPVNDHRMYLAYFGLIGAAVTGVLSALDRLASPVSGYAVIAIVASLSAVTQIRNQVWSSTETLWRDTVEKNPASGRAMNNLALVYIGRAEWPRAAELIDRCEVVFPNYSVCKVNQAIIQNSLGHDDRAWVKFREAIAADPRSTSTHLYFADFLQHRGFYDQAIAEYREVNRLAEGANLRAILAWVDTARMLGRKREIAEALEIAARRFRGYPEYEAERARGDSG